MKAKDFFNIEGPWATLDVMMPLSYSRPFLPIIERLLERFPYAFPILRHLVEVIEK
jgi:hypothetical protein